MKNEYWTYGILGVAAVGFVAYWRTRPRPLTEDEYEAVRAAPIANLEDDPFPLSPKYMKPRDPMMLEGYITESQPVYGAPYSPGRAWVDTPDGLILPIDFSDPREMNTPNKPAGHTPKTPKQGRQPMRLGTANIKNFPDMPTGKVQADGRKMGSLTTIWGGQEITPNEDSGPIMEALGENWGILFSGNETPIFYRKDKWNVGNLFDISLGDRGGIPLSARNSAITSAVFRSEARPGLSPFAVVNCHLMRNFATSSAKERAQWKIEYGHLKEVVAHHYKNGRTVFVVGDTNNRLTPFPANGGRWLAGNGRLDKIGILRHPQSVRITRTNGNPNGEIHTLNSDHDGFVIDVELDG
jgi:hypothetical protein